MGKHPQKFREELSNKACLSQVLVQELKKSPQDINLPHLQSVVSVALLSPSASVVDTRDILLLSHFKLHSAAVTEVFCKFFSKEGEI